MNITKIVTTSNTTPLISMGNLYQFKNTCLDLKCCILNMPVSSVKERLLFYIDSLIDGDIYFCLEEIKNSIERMRSIISQASVASNIECLVISLNDIFITIYRKNIAGRSVHVGQIKRD